MTTKTKKTNVTKTSSKKTAVQKTAVAAAEGGKRSVVFNAFARGRDANGLTCKDHVAIYCVQNGINHASVDVIADVRANVKYKGTNGGTISAYPDQTLRSWIGTFSRGYNFPRRAYALLNGSMEIKGIKIPAKNDFKDNVHVANDGRSHEDYVAEQKKIAAANKKGLSAAKKNA